jgi:dTMP kinase
MELFLKDREMDVKDRILLALEEGKIVIMDRYYYSNRC